MNKGLGRQDSSFPGVEEPSEPVRIWALSERHVQKQFQHGKVCIQNDLSSWRKADWKAEGEVIVEAAGVTTPQDEGSSGDRKQ